MYRSIPGPVGSTWYTIIYLTIMGSGAVLAVAMERIAATARNASTIDHAEATTHSEVLA